MSTTPRFTLTDLKRILLEGAGCEEGVDLDADIIDTELAALGYESLALLETLSRIEREFHVQLDDSLAAQARTPRVLIEAVNAGLDAETKAA